MAQDEGGVLVGAVLGGRERVEGGVQGAADTEVVVVEEVQPAVGAGEPGGERVRGEGPAGGEAGCDDAQRQGSRPVRATSGCRAVIPSRPDAARSSAALSSSLSGRRGSGRRRRGR